MANAARADLLVRCVTPVTVCVGLQSDRDGLSGARGIVTSGATLCRTAGAAVVGGVVELHIEALDKFRRERLYRRVARLCIGVADSTHCLVFTARELV